MVKYHQNESIVNDICKNKALVFLNFNFVEFCYVFQTFLSWQEELGEWEYNPDVPSMKLFRCWDSSAVISKNDQSKSVNIRREGELSAASAASLMLGPHI